MNANEATAAIRNLTYAKYDTPEGELYSSEQARITNEFKEYLVDEYAFNLPATTHSALWSKAWEDGHSYGFGEIESHYANIVEFAEELLKASKK